MSSLNIDQLTLVVTAALAFLGWGLTYVLNVRRDTLKHQIEFTNRQLKYLYGPLYLRLKASDRTWELFWAKYQPKHGQGRYFSGPTTESEKQVWRNWMRNVFEPMNARTEEVLTNNIDLLSHQEKSNEPNPSGELPSGMVNALAHIASYKAVLSKWDAGDFTEHVALNDWPGKELLEIVESDFQSLREKQQKLLQRRF